MNHPTQGIQHSSFGKNVKVKTLTITLTWITQKRAHTPSMPKRSFHLTSAKHRILDEIGFLLGYFPFLWSCHDFSFTSLVSPEPKVFVLCPPY